MPPALRHCVTAMLQRSAFSLSGVSSGCLTLLPLSPPSSLLPFSFPQAYREIAEQRRSKSSQLASAQNAILQKRKVKRRSELCLAEVQALPEDTVSFKAVGRMYDRDMHRLRGDADAEATRAMEDAERG